ncbi:MAG: hypothetical protein A2144_02710 [Chloroflexi bacterium RBG_16_50_9]|nr:MAG: hypothetical protein A2144_02710 [Chloroflexi bacterium RBG_16_50_9]
MKKLISGVLLVILLLGTIACARAPAPAPAFAPAPAPAPMPAIGSSRGDESVTTPSIKMPAPAPPRETSADFESVQSLDIERMIVRTATMALVVEDVASSVERIANLAGTYHGYVVSSNSWRDGERLIGNIVIRVTVENFDAALAVLRGMAVKVNSESTTGKDVTEEYVDLSAKLRNLEAAEVQLLKLMAEKTEKVTDILEVQRELVKTRGEIEQTKGRMQYLEQSSSMSLIQVSLEQSKLDVEFNANRRNVKAGETIFFEPRVAGGFAPYSFEWDFGDGTTSTSDYPSHAYKSDGSYTVILKVTDDKGYSDSQERDDYIVVLPGWSAGNVASSAWHGLATFGRVIADIIIWLGIFSPVWIIIGVILYFAWWRRRKRA